jgi:riboflavin biosynthesis pyrimidine reductase
MDLRTLPALLAALGINTLMVEGGADLIRQFLATPGLVDLLVVTVAPVLVPDGYGVEAAGTVSRVCGGGNAKRANPCV